MSEPPKQGRSYVLATAAYNEERFLGKTIASVVSQTVRPEKWIIVSDGSTDRTDAIVQEYSNQYSFIQLLRISEEHPRDFAAQVNAINQGFAQLKRTDYAFIGNLDADVSFEEDYYSRLLEKFDQDSRLGLAGGFIFEEQGGVFRSRRANREESVPHAIQLFRRECYESIGDYLPLKYGGPDWHAEVVARMKGWRGRTFPELKVFHHRPTGTASGLLKYKYRQGKMDYAFGSYPLFEIIKCLIRLPEKPFVIGGATRLLGFAGSYLRKEKRPVSNEFIAFLRGEQKHRVLAFFKGVKPPPSN
jgi:biofilm PGA synthesis N-glycosyltransferase PgaC